jgi:hypothetical protein
MSICFRRNAARDNHHGRAIRDVNNQAPFVFAERAIILGSKQPL